MVFVKFSTSIQFFANFTIVMIGKETGHLLECVKPYGKCIDKIEAKHMLRGNIAATLLKFSWENLYSVKGNDKSNMNVFSLSIWENSGGV